MTSRCSWISVRPLECPDTLYRLEKNRSLPPFPSGDLDRRLQAYELVEGPEAGDVERLGLTDPRLARGCGPSDLAIDDGNQHRLLVLEVPVEAASAGGLPTEGILNCSGEHAVNGIWACSGQRTMADSMAWRTAALAASGDNRLSFTSADQVAYAVRL